ncbi:hypothetical protein AMJ39_00335, partial [candidate division TA06 bacterium DG_24]
AAHDQVEDGDNLHVLFHVTLLALVMQIGGSLQSVSLYRTHLRPDRRENGPSPVGLVNHLRSES